VAGQIISLLTAIFSLQCYKNHNIKTK